MGVVGLDIGGTFVKGGSIGVAGPDLRQRVATHTGDGSGAVLETVLSCVTGLTTAARERGTVDAVGVAALGIVDEVAGIARSSATIGWENVPLRSLVAERVSVPVVLVHDVRAAAVAEAVMGAGRGQRNVVFVPLGTGLSAAQVIDGSVVAGASWRAGEIGQLPVAANASLENVVSARALAVGYAQQIGAPCGDVDASSVVALAREGDVVATRALNRSLTILADVLSVVVSFADPSVVVIGGGLSLAGDDLVVDLRDRVAAAIGWRELPPFRRARFGDEAGWVGAALLAWRHAGHADDAFPTDGWPDGRVTEDR